MAEKKIRTEMEFNYRLIGVASSLKEYKFCYHLNQLLNVDFIKLNDLVFQSTDRTRPIQFGVFKAGDEEEKNQFFVFNNKNLGEVLLLEAVNFDFIIQIKGECNEKERTAILDGIKAFPEILICAEIPLKKIKSKERLVYFEETFSVKPIKKFK